MAEEKLSASQAIVFDEKQYSELRSRIAHLRPLADRARVLKVESERLPVLESRIAELSSSVIALETEVKRLEKEMASMGYEDGDLKKAQALYEQAFRNRENAINEVTRKAASLDLLFERLSDRERSFSEVTELEKGNLVNTKKLEELSVLGKLMRDFRQDVMELIVPTLSEISSQLFVDMTDSKYGGIELDEDYEIQIYDGGEKFPVGRFSGGESDLANLCLRLAISRVIADRSGNDINFLILDEIFGSQDQVRKRNIMSTLNQLEKQFHQIILITHIDDTKDYMSYVINIKELEDGTSTITI